MPTPSRERIRVLVLIKGLGLGGAETLLADAAPLWDSDTFEYRVAYMLPWKDQLRARLAAAGIEVFDLGWQRVWSLTGMMRLRSLSAGFHPDIVHSHLPASGFAARVLLPSATHVYTEHNIVDHYRQPTRTLNRLTYGRNSVVVAVSEAVADSVSSYPGPQPIVIANGVQVDNPSSTNGRIREELGLPEDARLVVHVGNIRPLKGHGNLLQATKLLSETHPQAVVVSVGGEKNAGDIEKLRSAADAAGIGAFIRFVGRRHDARAFMASADCVVNPSDVEGLPVALLEALALARPVVATNVGGVPDIVKNERTGLLVPPDDPGSLARAIGRCLDSPDASSWGAEGRSLVDASYSLSAMVKRYEDVYRTLVDG